MPTPTHNFLISGTVYSNSLIKGRSEIRVAITGSGGKSSQHIYIGGGTTTEKSLTLYVENLTTEEVYPRPVITSSTTGKYLFDCKNFTEGFSTDDEILIRASTVTTTLNVAEDRDEGTVRQNEYHESAGARKRILVNEDGNEFNSQNPIPTKPITEDFSGLNYSMAWTHDSSGRMITETRTYKGKSIRRTWSFTGNNYYSDGHTSWVEI